APGHLRDLVVPVACNVMQHEHLTLPRSQLRHRPLEIDARVEVIARIHNPASPFRPLSVIRIDTRAPTSVAATVLEYHVDGHAMRPARERGVPTKRPERLPDPDEHVLQQLRRALAVADHV